MPDGSRRAGGDHRPGVEVDAIRRRIGIVFQAFNLFPHMRVLENITLGPRKVLHLPEAEAERQAIELLERFGLGDKRSEYPDRLSGGQQQRVAIIRALAMRPDVLLLDEVTALDPELVAEVLDVIRGLAVGGMTMMHRDPRDELRARHRRPASASWTGWRDPRGGPPDRIFRARAGADAAVPAVDATWLAASSSRARAVAAPVRGDYLARLAPTENWPPDPVNRDPRDAEAEHERACCTPGVSDRPPKAALAVPWCKVGQMFPT